MAKLNKKTPTPSSSMSSSKSYSKQDSINYVRGTERMSRAATELKKASNPYTKQGAMSDFKKAQGEVSSNPYYNTKVKGTKKGVSAKKVTVPKGSKEYNKVTKKIKK